MNCEFCNEKMKKVVDEAMGISYECEICGHTIDVFYTSQKKKE